MSLTTMGTLVDLLIWDWAWVSIPTFLVIAVTSVLRQTRTIGLRSLAFGLVGGLLWVVVCHAIDWLDRGVLLFALPVAYIHEFGSGFAYVGVTTLFVLGVRRGTLRDAT